MASAIAACSPFGASSASDAGVPGAEASTKESGAFPDAAAAVKRCSDFASDTTIVFCADFEGSSPDLGFDDSERVGSSVLPSLTGAPGRAGNALRMSLPEGNGGRATLLSRSLSSVRRPARYELTFDVLLERCTLTYAALGLLGFTGQGLALFAGAATYEFGRRIGSLSPKTSELLTSEGRWYRVVSTVDVTESDAHAVVTVDGVTIFDRVEPEFERAAQADVRVGVFFTGGEKGAADVLFDDVVVRIVAP